MATDELAFAGLARQAALVRSRDVSPRELVELALARIGAIDPRLNAFRVVFAERAQAEAGAARADDAPLRGVPVAVKDDMDVAGEVTAQGTGAAVTPARVDAEVVRRLRAAGAIVVGKTAMPELGQWGAFTESATYGITRNPWDLSRSTGGSSGGSAAAVAAGLVPAAMGSDGGASVRVPAACCGLVGIKPQRGRVPTAPFDERWHGLVAYGPLARTVHDAALLLDVASGGAGAFAAAALCDPSRLRVAVSTAAGVPWRGSPPRPSAPHRPARARRSRGLRRGRPSARRAARRPALGRGDDHRARRSARASTIVAWRAPAGSGRMTRGTSSDMSEKAQDLGGRVKEAGGALTGDDDLKNEGKVDQASASVKEKVGDAADKVKDVVNPKDK